MGSQAGAIVDKLLTRVSDRLSPTGYVSEIALTPHKVKQQSGKLGSYGNDHLRIVNTVMGGQGKARRIQSFTESSSNYYIDDHGLSDVVTKNDRKNFEQPFDAREDKMLGLIDLIWLAKEKGLADQLTSTSTMTQNVTLSGSAQFSDFANSDPIGKFKDGRAAILDAIGVMPDTAIIPLKVADCLQFHPAMLESLGYKDNRPGGLNFAELKSALRLKTLYIAEAVHNSAAEGQTDVIAPVWGKHIVLYKKAPAAQKRQKTLGYYLTYTDGKPRKVFRNMLGNPPQSEEIIVTDDYDMFLSDVTSGYLIENAIA